MGSDMGHAEGAYKSIIRLLSMPAGMHF